MNVPPITNILLFLILIVLMTMCSRMPKQDKPPKQVKEYSIVYPNGDTVQLR